MQKCFIETKDIIEFFEVIGDITKCNISTLAYSLELTH